MSEPKGNPVGSREAGLSQRCVSVVIGTILGDGCLERNGRNVRLRIDHSLKQKSFVEWKFQELLELDPRPPRVVRRVDPRTQRLHENYRFATCTTQALNQFFSLFHGDGHEKRIPVSIKDWLTTPLSVAVWYMDDGGRRSDCRSGYLNTNAYQIDDVYRLRNCLKQRFGVATKTHLAAGKPRIYIPRDHFGNFCELIRPFVIPEMSYKLL